jgi:hypothetical protein
VPTVSSSSPRLIRVKTEIHTLVFWSIEHVFREAGLAVNWFAHCRLERYSGGFAALCTFDFEHSFLERVNHLYCCWA